MKKLLLIAAALCFTVAAQAQVVFNPSIFYSTSEEDYSPGSTTSSSDSMAIDLKLGYVMPMGLYLGGMYSLLDGAAATHQSPGSDPDRSGNLIGATIGYYSMVGFYLLGTYHIMGESTASSGGTETKYTDGKGFQFDIGWVFPVTSGFSIGPQLSYVSTTYDDTETNGTSTNVEVSKTSIRPYLSLWFMF